jgi:hypothetical protein
MNTFTHCLWARPAAVVAVFGIASWSGVADAEPAPADVTQFPSGEVSTRNLASSQTGWALGAAIGGFSAAGTALVLAGGAEALRTNQAPAMSLGAVATSLLAAGGPIVFMGGNSARSESGVRGSFGLRLTGWITYGLTLADATSLLGVGAANLTVPPGLIISAGLLGALSLTFFSIDALISRHEAIEAESARTSAVETSFRVLPVASAARLPDGSTHPVFGFAGSF